MNEVDREDVLRVGRALIAADEDEKRIIAKAKVKGWDAGVLAIHLKSHRAAHQRLAAAALVGIVMDRDDLAMLRALDLLASLQETETVAVA